MNISPKLLVERMTPTLRTALELAVGRSASMRCYEVTVEHLVQAMVSDEGSDAKLILRAYGISHDALLARLHAIVQRLPQGATGRPVFSGSLWPLAEHAWLYGSLLFDGAAIRTGHVLYTLGRHPGRYTTGDLAPELELLAPELEKELTEVVADSREASENQSTITPRSRRIPTTSLSAFLDDVALGIVSERGEAPSPRELLTAREAFRARTDDLGRDGSMSRWTRLVVVALQAGVDVDEAARVADETLLLTREVSRTDDA